jgi:hypothetical protein
MKILTMYFKVKYCKVSKDVNLQIIKSANIPRKLPKCGQNTQK